MEYQVEKLSLNREVIFGQPLSDPQDPIRCRRQTNEDGHPIAIRFIRLKGLLKVETAQRTQRHLAEFCYRFNRRFKLEDTIVRLGHGAVRTPPMPQHLLNVADTRIKDEASISLDAVRYPILGALSVPLAQRMVRTVYILFRRVFLVLTILPLLAGCAAAVVGMGSGDLLMDTAIKNSVENALAEDPVLKQRKIFVSCSGGEVTLHGRVMTDAEVLQAQSLAEGVFGVKGAVSKLMVERPTPPPRKNARKVKQKEQVCTHMPRSVILGAARITGSRLNVRTGAGTHCTRIAHLNPADIFTLTGKRGNWYKIRMSDGDVGWVYGPLVSRLDTMPVPTPPTRPDL